MKEGNMRIVMVTAGVWSADQLHRATQALDGLVCRLAMSSLIAQVVSRYEAQFTNWRAFGLLGKPPSDWGDCAPGTEALVRNDVLEFASALRRHGITLSPGELTWELAFNVDDILELVPSRRRLEVEFLDVGSPGLMSFLLPGFETGSKFSDVLLHLFNHLFHFRDMRRLMKIARRTAAAHALAEEARAEQELVKARREQLALLREQQSVESASAQSPLQVDSDATLKELVHGFVQAGGHPSEIKRLVLDPNERDLHVLCRLKCEGLIVGIGAADVEEVEGEEPR